jgi:hypothetical protein
VIVEIWAILIMPVEQLMPQTKKDLIAVINTASESVEMLLMNKLIDSIPNQLHEMIANQGITSFPI